MPTSKEQKKKPQPMLPDRMLSKPEEKNFLILDSEYLEEQETNPSEVKVPPKK